MAEQADRMRRLIDDLLGLSRIETSEHQAPSGRVELAALARAEAEAMAPILAGRRMTLQLDLAEAAAQPADADQIAQVLRNLLDNAIRHGREGGTIRLAIAPEAAPDGQPGVAVAVQDDGPGIPREHIPRLTERFYRVDKGRGRRAGGTGLGLAIVKHIVNRHRGRLTIESEEGIGTSFGVLAARAGEGRTAATPRARSGPAPAGPLRPGCAGRRCAASHRCGPRLDAARPRKPSVAGMDALIVTVVGLLLGGGSSALPGWCGASGAARRCARWKRSSPSCTARSRPWRRRWRRGFRPAGVRRRHHRHPPRRRRRTCTARRTAPEPLAEVRKPPQPGALRPGRARLPRSPAATSRSCYTHRWGVWLGAGALLLAAVFLIRIAVEEGGSARRALRAWRCCSRLLLILGGEWLARRPVPGAGGCRTMRPPPWRRAAWPRCSAPPMPPAALRPAVRRCRLPRHGAAGIAACCSRCDAAGWSRRSGWRGLRHPRRWPAASMASLPGLFAYLQVVTAAAMLVVRRTAWGWLLGRAVAGALWVFAAPSWPGTRISGHRRCSCRSPPLASWACCRRRRSRPARRPPRPSAAGGAGRRRCCRSPR